MSETTADNTNDSGLKRLLDAGFGMAATLTCGLDWPAWRVLERARISSG